jgi:hypothetical protein
MINNACWYYTIDVNVAGLRILNQDEIIRSVGLIIERSTRSNMFVESISSDLSYCCIGDFNETSGP